MDASAYLKRQGWRGDGHSLDHSNRGIRKPLLVSKKVDALGVGLNKHKAVSDQWWLRAFDEGLKSLGNGEESILAAVQKHGVNRGGLYGRFVKGERFAGSIGQTPQSSEEGSPSGTSTLAAQIKEAWNDIAVDVSAPEKLESVVDAEPNTNSQEAGMKKMLGKRKRAEQPGGKCAHRKIARQEDTIQDTREQRNRAAEEGTWDAQKSSDEIRKGRLSVGPATDTGVIPSNQPDDKMQQLTDSFASNTQVNDNNSSKSLRKADKYLREKMKRATKAHQIGEKLSHAQNHEETEAKKDEKKMRAAQKRADAAKKEAERLAKREKAAAQKKERRTRRQAEREQTKKSIEEHGVVPKADKIEEEYYIEPVEREAAVNTGGRMNDNEIENGIDQIKFSTNRKGGKKKMPGVGSVERHPTKAQKKAKKFKALEANSSLSDQEMPASLKAQEARIDPNRSMAHEMTLEEHRAAFERGGVHKSNVEQRDIAPKKLAEYKQRAAEKGVKLEDYIRRRDEKSRTKKVEKLGNPAQHDALNKTRNVIEHTAPLPRRPDVLATLDQLSTNAGDSAASGLSFIIDTEGDPALVRTSSQNQARTAIPKNRSARNRWHQDL